MRYVALDVHLLYHTPEPERAIAAAARICYAAVGASELLETMTDKQVQHLLKVVISSGHTSTLEHASYTFAIDGVSRALTHQLVRHRLASYNQQSQRYVTYSDLPEFIYPALVTENPEARALFNASMETAFKTYLALVETGIPAEDARYVLPNAMETKIVVTMNVRELLHFFELRCCNRAQWEIRAMAQRMLDLAEPTAPYVFMDAGPACRRGPCPEGKMTCGNPFPKAPKRE